MCESQGHRPRDAKSRWLDLHEWAEVLEEFQDAPVFIDQQLRAARLAMFDRSEDAIGDIAHIDDVDVAFEVPLDSPMAQIAHHA